MVWDWRPGFLRASSQSAPLTADEAALRRCVEQVRLKQHIEFLASPDMKGRENGTAGSEKAREYLVAELEALGVKPFFGGSFLQTIHKSGGAKVHGTNIAGVIPATGPNPDRTCVMVVGHYDHLGVGLEGIYAGADDNASGVAAALEIARAFAETKPSHAHDVVIALPDTEETPDVRTKTMGSTWMMDHLPIPTERVRLSISLDVIGNRSLGSDLFVLGAETCRNSADLVSRVPGETDAVPVTGSVPIIEQAPFLPAPKKRQHKGDYRGALLHGVPFLFVLSGTATTYHTTRDTPGSLDYPKLAAVTRYASGLVLNAANDVSDLAPFSGTAVDAVADVDGLSRVLRFVLLNQPPGLRDGMRETLEADLGRLDGFGKRQALGGALSIAEYQEVRAAALHLQQALARPDKRIADILFEEIKQRLGRQLVRWFPGLAP